MVEIPCSYNSVKQHMLKSNTISVPFAMHRFLPYSHASNVALEMEMVVDGSITLVQIDF